MAEAKRVLKVTRCCAVCGRKLRQTKRREYCPDKNCWANNA